MNIINYRIKDLRKSKNMTQAQLAIKLCVSISAVSRYENGTRELSLPLINKYSKIFNVPISYLYGEDIKVESQDVNDYVSIEDYKIISLIKENDDVYKLLLNDGERAVKMLKSRIKKY